MIYMNVMLTVNKDSDVEKISALLAEQARLFPNVTAIMERKGFTDVNQLMTEALTKTNVSFCTRNHFGRATGKEKNQYIRFAYSGIEVNDIEEGMKKLKAYFEC